MVEMSKERLTQVAGGIMLGALMVMAVVVNQSRESTRSNSVKAVIQQYDSQECSRLLDEQKLLAERALQDKDAQIHRERREHDESRRTINGMGKDQKNMKNKVKSCDGLIGEQEKRVQALLDENRKLKEQLVDSLKQQGQMLDKIQGMSSTVQKATDIQGMFEVMKEEYKDAKERADLGRGPYKNSTVATIDMAESTEMLNP